MENKQQEVWLKAAVIGSIWASFEIIFGSFFHSLRLPFAGTFLTFTSIVLLIAFSYKWNDKGLFLKAGIIAALMRSLMPTSVILGPLIGILIEALLFQWAIRLFGRNMLAFTVAGVLALFSAILHKIVSIILIYGFDIVKILENLYYVFLRITHLKLPVAQLFQLVVLVYITMGIVAALTGRWVGKKLVNQSLDLAIKPADLKIQNDLFEIHNFKYHPVYLFIHIGFLILFLIGLEWLPLIYTIVPMAGYLLWLLKRYGKSLRRLAKPLFWFQLLIIVLMAVWLWDDKWEGLTVGMKMILRAILVVSVFTAISVELKNPLVKALLYKKGYSQLYATLGLATSAVPFILKNIAVDKKLLLHPFKVLQKAIGLSDILLQEFIQKMQQHNKIFIISGPTRSGKTTFLNDVIADLRQTHPELKIGGILAHGMDVNGSRFGFQIEDIATGNKHFLSSIQPQKNHIQIGRFYFDEEGLRFGHQALTQNLDKNDVLIIDEVGYLELQGKGWFEAIEKAMNQDNLNIIMVVRKRLLENILQLWRDKHFVVIDIDKQQPDDLAKMI